MHYEPQIEQGIVQSVVVAITDLSDRKRAEERCCSGPSNLKRSWKPCRWAFTSSGPICAFARSTPRPCRSFRGFKTWWGEPG